MSAVTRLCLFNLVCLSCGALRDPPTVNIPNQGMLVGKEISLIRTQRIIAYLGIPYAKPPERFAPPDTDELPVWDGVRNATEYEAGCMQNKENIQPEDEPFNHLLSDQDLPYSEDCLYLNVFVPYGE